MKKVIRTSVGKRYLGVPDDLPTRFVVEDLDLQKKKKQKGRAAGIESPQQLGS